MIKNMATPDRILRLIAGVTIVALYATGVLSGTLGLVLMIVSIVFVVTSLINFCPLYTVLGIRRWEGKNK